MYKPFLVRPKMWLYLLLLAVTIATMVMLNRCSRQAATSQFVAASGDTLNVAIEYSPLSLYMYDDTLGGFNHDLLALIQIRAARPVKMHPIVNLKQSLELLNDGTFDIVAAQLPSTTDFKNKFLFSDSIYIDRQVLVQKRDSLGNVAIRSQLDVAGRTLYVVDGSPVVTRIRNFAREIGDTINVVTERRYGQEQLFLMVNAGEIDFAVINEKLAKTMAKRYPAIDVSTAVSFNQFQSWVLKKDNRQLADSLNRWLSDVRTTSAFKELYKRYF